LTCFADDDKKVKKQSRKDAREEQAKQKTAERETGVGATDENPLFYKRGVALRDRATAAQMESSAFHQQQKNVRDLLALANADHSCTLKELGEVSALMKDASPQSKPEYKRWFSEVKTRLQEIKSKKKSLEDQSDQLMNTGTTVLVQQFYNEVTNSNVAVTAVQPPVAVSAVQPPVAVSVQPKPRPSPKSPLTIDSNLVSAESTTGVATGPPQQKKQRVVDVDADDDDSKSMEDTEDNDPIILRARETLRKHYLRKQKRDIGAESSDSSSDSEEEDKED
jgi:hypothetical protein